MLGYSPVTTILVLFMTLLGRPVIAGETKTPMNLQVKFETLAKDWADHCRLRDFSSNMRDCLNAPAFGELVKLGRPAVTLIMKQYSQDDLPWAFVLQKIVGKKILFDEKQFNPGRVRGQWLDWWKREKQNWLAINTPRWSLEEFKRHLSARLSADEARRIFGNPERDLGSGLYVYEYPVQEGGSVILSLGPNLMSAKYIKESGESELLFPVQGSDHK